ncbi:MAG: hypothetical protein V4640_02080 [Verrucomicrobiota bacterium]
MMHPPSEVSPAKSRLALLGLIAVTLVVGAASISQQSFWMDEGSAALKAIMPTFREWWKMTLELRGSDVQMPVYMATLWLWEKVAGNSEFALRAFNLPFLVLMVVALRKVPLWPLVCLTSPFVLYYVGELRPYTMQMAGGALAAAALAKVCQSRANHFDGLNAIFAAALFLAASSLTAAVWAGGLVLGAIVIHPYWLKSRGFWTRAAIWFSPFLALGGYYVFTLVEGYRATGSGGGGLLSIAFGAYEIGGLLGLGPSRNELRSSPLALVSHLPWLIPAAAILFLAWFIGAKKWFKETPFRNRVGILCAVLVPVFLLAAVSVIADFRVLGRHLSPAIPAVLLPLACCLANAARKPFALTVGTLAILLSITSALSLRFQRKHARDDYRAATRIALQALADGKAVLWQADMSTPCYYAYRSGGVAAFHNALRLKSETPSGFMFADIVILNRPDIGYRGQNHHQTLTQAAFVKDDSFNGFEVWSNRYSSPTR